VFLRIKSLEKSIAETIATKLLVTGTKDKKKIILPGLGLKKVENH
jgi:hypothetical protein